jgi:hypothetical protein
VQQERLAEWLGRLVEQGRLQPAERDDLMRQRELFELNRPSIEAEYAGSVVGYIDGQAVVGGSVPDVLFQSERYSGQIYLEQIPGRNFAAGPGRSRSDEITR